MTIESAIHHCEEVEKNQEEACEWCGKNTPPAQDFKRCASEHRQLAEWLRELKAYRESWEELFSTVYEIKANAESEDIQTIAEFLVNYMLILEKRIKEVKADE